ncbi:DnaB-like helicase C-terminal domain-containing protein [Loktanella sp. DJP18]|uniref:DnaB-like helicase C-terminal domain-containing protein n=1 Tax=Loktanella sp. DJP18 TaxID=3409788 RepID=UPI003BB7B2A3
MMQTSSLLTLEAQVIGAVLANPGFFNRAALLSDDAFNDPNYKALWHCVFASGTRGEDLRPAPIAVRYASVVEPMGGIAFLNRLVLHSEDISSVFNEAVDRLHDELQWRRITAISLRLTSAVNSREKSPSQILSGLETLCRSHLSGGRLTTRTKSEVAKAAIDSARNKVEADRTGIDSLDLMMQGGLQPKRLYGIGAQFGRGKTVLLGTVSDNLNIQKAPHLFLSLETPPEDIELRACARHMKLNVSAIHDSGDPDHETFIAKADSYVALASDYTYYDYSPQATIDEIVRKILASKARYGIKGFILDYWQLVRGRQKGQSEDDHMTEVADRLAAICRQEDLWGIVTAQVDERGRLKKSDALYQSASLYIRLCREENETRAYFVTEKSNYTRYTDNGNESISLMVFDDSVGPQFRNTESVDIPDLAQQSEDAIIV